MNFKWFASCKNVDDVKKSYRKIQFFFCFLTNVLCQRTLAQFGQEQVVAPPARPAGRSQ